MLTVLEKRDEYKEILEGYHRAGVTWSETACVLAETMAGCLDLAEHLAHGEGWADKQRDEAGALMGLTSSEAQHVVSLAIAIFDKLVVDTTPVVIHALAPPATISGNRM